MYNKKHHLEYDGSMIPAEWFGWMHYKTDLPPTEKPPVRRADTKSLCKFPVCLLVSYLSLLSAVEVLKFLVVVFPVLPLMPLRLNCQELPSKT